MGLCVSTNPSIFGRRAAGVNVGRRKGLKKKKKVGLETAAEQLSFTIKRENSRAYSMKMDWILE